MRIAIIDPFYDVSHRIWSEGLQRQSFHEIEIYSLSAIHWKWKMASGALSLAEKVNQSEQVYDLLITTDMLDVGLFKSLLTPANQNKPILLYFHENQLTYPWSATDPDKSLQRDHHYAWINFTSAVVSDRICFNSEYHRKSFLTALPTFIHQFPSSGLAGHIEDIRAKSSVLQIGLELKPIQRDHKSTELTILWNHRWESDKNPELFYRACRYLQNQHIPFRLIICGQEYQRRPAAFDHMRGVFSEEILHWGFVESRAKYWHLLSKSSLILVTSHQDFFGISTVEAIHAGCIPLLPNRLAFPEHIPQKLHNQLLYDSETDLYHKMPHVLKSDIDLTELQAYIQKYNWSSMIGQYHDLFKEIRR